MRIFARIILLLVVLTVPSFAWAQDDSPVDVIDSLIQDEYDNYSYDDEYAEEWQGEGIDDSTVVSKRSFDEKVLRSLQEDDDFNFKQPPTIAESLMDRFFYWLGEFFNRLYAGAVTTDWGKIMVFILTLVIAVFIIMAVMKVDAFKLFYRGQSSKRVRHNILDENIHSIDFESEIQRALEAKDYKLGVRLIFLYALKTLSDKQLVSWEQGKTNYDYVAELGPGDIKKGFIQLSYYFDYVWYGNFSASRELFDKVNTIFIQWKDKVR